MIHVHQRLRVSCCGPKQRWRGRPAQLKPSKWPLRMRSPIGLGARRGLLSETVFERRALRICVVGGTLVVALDGVMGLAVGLGGPREVGESISAVGCAIVVRDTHTPRW